MRGPVRVDADRDPFFRFWSERYIRSNDEHDFPPHADGRLFHVLNESVPGSRGKLGDLKILRDFIVRSDDIGPLPRDLDSDEDVAVFDRLAWYSSFRGGPSWGIFIREAGIVRLGNQLAGLSGQPLADCDFFAFKALYLHEYAHFLVDVGVAMIEQLSDRDMYAAHRSLREPPPGWSPTEEALCNAFAVQNLGDAKLKGSLKKVLANAPQGYRDFGRYASPATLDGGVQAVFGEVLVRAGLPDFVSHGSQLLFDQSSRVVTPLSIPVYLVPEPREDNLFYTYLTALGTVRETRKFQKQLSKAPVRARREWAKRKPLLEVDIPSAGGNFKSLQGNLSGVYSIRLGDGWRAKLQQVDGEWLATEVEAHDDAYRN